MASLEGAVLMTPSPGEPEVERKLSRREEVQKKRVTEVAASMYAGAAEQMQGGGASGDGGGGGLAAAGVGDGKKETPVAEEDSVDPRSLSSWPPLSAGSAGQQKVHSAAGGPLTIAFQECMPIRAKTALAKAKAQGTEAAKTAALAGLSPEVQWLYSLCFIAEAVERHPGRRRFVLQEKTGQEVLLIDVLDAPGVLTCPSDQAAVPHGPDGLRARLKQSLSDISEEELEAIMEGALRKKGAPTEAEEAALRAEAPLVMVRFQHEFRGLPDSNARIQTALKAVGDGCLESPHVKQATEMNMGMICVQAESVAEVRAAAKMLRANHRALTKDYAAHFASLSKAHAGNTDKMDEEEGEEEGEEEEGEGEGSAKAKGKAKGSGGGGGKKKKGKGKKGGGAASEEGEAESESEAAAATAAAVNAASAQGFLPSFLVPPTAVPEKLEESALSEEELQAAPQPGPTAGEEQAPTPPKATGGKKEKRRGKRDKR